MNPIRKFILLLALAIDLILGDPPNRFHPVAWMGSLIAKLKQNRPYGDPNIFVLLQETLKKISACWL